MAKVFKVWEPAPRSLSLYERMLLEEMVFIASEGGPDLAGTREALLSEARREAARKVQEAYAEGIRRGIDAGKAQYMQAVAESAGALRSAAAVLQQTREDFLRSLEPQVVELAVAVAERIVQREVRIDPEFVQRTVRKALDHLLDRERVVVRLNPKDLEGLRAEKVKLLEEFDGIREITVQSDAAVGPGGCIVETGLLQVDARIEAQLEQILQALHEAPEPLAPKE